MFKHINTLKTLQLNYVIHTQNLRFAFWLLPSFPAAILYDDAQPNVLIKILSFKSATRLWRRIDLLD